MLPAPFDNLIPQASRRSPMYGFLKIAACSALLGTGFLGTGCRATDRLTNWTSKDAQTNVQVAEELASRIEKTNPGLTPAASSNRSNSTSLEEKIRQGQTEVAAWYQDQSPQHLTVAKGHFTSVLVENPHNSRAHHGLAIIADLEKDYAEAERHYQQALIQNPNNSDVLGDMGYSYLLQNRLSESEQYSLRAIQARATNKKAIKHLADAYARQGKTELAEKTYKKVLSAEDVQAALAENAPEPKEEVAVTNPSLMDRLIPGKSKGEKLAEEIRQRQQEYAERVRQAKQSDPRMAAAPIRDAGQGRMSHDEVLKHRLQLIDAEEAPQNPGSPILIDDQTGRTTRLSGADTSPNWPQANGTATTFPSTVVNSQRPMQPSNPGVNGASYQRSADPRPEPPQQPDSPYFANDNRGAPAGGRTMNGQSFATQAPSNGAYRNPEQSNQPGNVSNDYSRNNSRYSEAQASADQGYPRRAENSMQRPWNGIQQMANSAPGSAENSIQSAYHQFDPNQQQRVSQANAQTPPGRGMGPSATQANSHAAPSSGQFPQADMYAMGGRSVQNSMGSMNQQNGPSGGDPNGVQTVSGQNANAPGDSYQQASDAAARLGMGLGPAGKFPGYNPQLALNPPGSMGYDAPPPKRYMPDQLPPPDLNQAYQPYSNPVRPPAYSQGGQMPDAVTPNYTREQFGTASRYDTTTLQNSDVPQDYNTSMRGYEAQRWEAGRQLNHAVQQVWNQGPVNSPVSPSAGSVYTHPSSGGAPTYTPNAVSMGKNAGGNVTIGLSQTPEPKQNTNQNTVQPTAWPYQNNMNADNFNSSVPGQQGQQSPGNYGSPNEYGNSPGTTSPLGNDQYGNNQYSVGQSHAQPIFPDAYRSNQPGRNDVITPSEYQSASRSQPMNENRVSPASGIEQQQWPAIRPASR